MLITDRDEAHALFSDEEIDAFLSMENDSVRLAAAAALEAIARSEVLVLKVIETLSLKTDGAAVARELRQSARELREAEDSEGAFAVITMVDSKAGYLERIRKNRMRSYV